MKTMMVLCVLAGVTVFAFADGVKKYTSPVSDRMTTARLGKIIEEHAEVTASESFYWEFTHTRVRMACITDARSDRMRIIAPITRVADLDDGQLAAMMDANFHSALDARYATSDGVVYATFIHPLSPLSEREVVSALRQVAGCALTFGSSYSSGELIFGGDQQEEETTPVEEQEPEDTGSDR